MKKVFKLMLLILWMILIFCFSNQRADDSSKLSDGVIVKVASIFVKDNLTDNKKNELIDKYTFIIRKTAHFSVYLILGILSINLLSSFNIKRIIMLSSLFCFIYACTDEYHQLFVMGRSCEMRDVLIDTLGSFVGILIYYKIKLYINKRQKLT